jgi:hypothetical protein
MSMSETGNGPGHTLIGTFREQVTRSSMEENIYRQVLIVAED